MIYYIECIHCNNLIEIHHKDLNCKIFTHAQFKDGKNINPHIRRTEVEELIKKDLIYGCGYQFKFDGKNIEKCSGL